MGLKTELCTLQNQLNNGWENPITTSSVAANSSQPNENQIASKVQLILKMQKINHLATGINGRNTVK